MRAFSPPTCAHGWTLSVHNSYMRRTNRCSDQKIQLTSTSDSKKESAMSKHELRTQVIGSSCLLAAVNCSVNLNFSQEFLIASSKRQQWVSEINFSTSISNQREIRKHVATPLRGAVGRVIKSLHDKDWCRTFSACSGWLQQTQGNAVQHT